MSKPDVNFTIGADGSAFAGALGGGLHKELTDITIIKNNKIAWVIHFKTDFCCVVNVISYVTLVVAQVQQLKVRHGTQWCILIPNKSKKNKRP